MDDRVIGGSEMCEHPTTSVDLTESAEVLQVKNHNFDLAQRKRNKKRKISSDIIKDPHAPVRGDVSVRQHHKVNNAKMLALTKLGKT